MVALGTSGSSARSWRSRIQFFIAIAVLALMFVIALGDPSHAHAIVERTTPAADETVEESPGSVAIAFNEPVEVNFGGIRVFDTDANQVDDGQTEHVSGSADQIQVGLEPDLDDGTYTVTWRVVSVDGHPISEAFVFHVGEPGEKPEGIAAELLRGDGEATALTGGLFGIARWIIFASLLVIAGAFFFALFVWRRSSGERLGATSNVFARRLGRIYSVSTVALVIATAAGFLLQGAVAGGLSLGEAIKPDVMGEVAQTRYGIVSFVRIGLILAAIVCWRLGLKPALQDRRSVGAAAAPHGMNSLVIVGAIVVTGLLATPGLAGHAGTTPPVALNILSDVLHLVAASAWIGGLFLLIFVAFPAAGELPARDQTSLMANVVGRFSRVAVIAVGVIVATGAYRTWTEVGAWHAFTGASYGHVLIVKLAVFVPLVVLGAINNRWTLPRIKKTADAGGDAEPALKRLKRDVASEVALAVVVLGLTALLVNLPPARVAAGVTGPFIENVALGPYDLQIIIDPNEIGENEIHLTATDEEGRPAPIKAETVLFRMPEQDIGPLREKGRKLAPGHFVVQGQLSVGGTWQLEIVARTDRFNEERTTASVEVNE